jgi:hypothetical protein
LCDAGRFFFAGRYTRLWAPGRMQRGPGTVWLRQECIVAVGESAAPGGSRGAGGCDSSANRG